MNGVKRWMMKSVEIEIAGAALGFAGLLIIGFEVGWVVSLGVFLMIFGNNLQMSNRKNKS